MKQLVELDPAVVAFRSVTESYTRGTFENGVFRVPLGELSGRQLENMQTICAQDALLGDGTRPSDSFKVAVGKLACISTLPAMLSCASYLDIARMVHEVMDPLEGPTDKEFMQVFGSAPNSVETYFIQQAREEIVDSDLLIGHPEQRINVPEVFMRALPEAEEYFRLYSRNARSIILSDCAKEYLAGSELNSWKISNLSPALEPKAHKIVTDWSNEDKLVEAFMEIHGNVQEAQNYASLAVGLDHIDDLTTETSVLTNENTNQVGRQFANLLLQLIKIRHYVPS